MGFWIGFEKAAKKSKVHPDVKWHHRVRPAAGLVAGTGLGFYFGAKGMSHLLRHTPPRQIFPALLAALGAAAGGAAGGAVGLGTGIKSIPKDIQKKMMKGLYKDPSIKDPKVRAELKKEFG